jgi:hypothetical protein
MMMMRFTSGRIPFTSVKPDGENAETDNEWTGSTMSTGMWDVVFFDLLHQMGGEDVKPRTLSWFTLKLKADYANNTKLSAVTVPSAYDYDKRRCAYEVEALGQFAPRLEFLPGLLAFLSQESHVNTARVLYVCLHEAEHGGPSVFVCAYKYPHASPDDCFIKYAKTNYFYGECEGQLGRSVLEYPARDLVYCNDVNEVETAIRSLAK